METLLQYLHDTARQNLLAQENHFRVDYCTGPDALQAVMDSYRDTANFLLIDDTATGATASNRVGWFTRRTHTLFILAAWDQRDDGSYQRALNLCRELLRQLLARIIHDRATQPANEMLMYLKLQSVYTQEFGRYSFNGATGVMAMIDNELPTSLTYDPTLWQTD